MVPWEIGGEKLNRKISGLLFVTRDRRVPQVISFDLCGWPERRRALYGRSSQPSETTDHCKVGFSQASSVRRLKELTLDNKQWITVEANALADYLGVPKFRSPGDTGRH
jgi:hypothetical protein